jgi:hypothetical protein
MAVLAFLLSSLSSPENIWKTLPESATILFFPIKTTCLVYTYVKQKLFGHFDTGYCYFMSKSEHSIGSQKIAYFCWKLFKIAEIKHYNIGPRAISQLVCIHAPICRIPSCAFNWKPKKWNPLRKPLHRFLAPQG